MDMKDNNDFIHMITTSLLGALTGLFAGLMLGLLIQGITLVLPGSSMMEDGPQLIAPFLGMGFGTLVGAILGGMLALKK